MSRRLHRFPCRRLRRSLPASVLGLALLCPVVLSAGDGTAHRKTAFRRNTDCQLLLTEKRLLGWDVSDQAGLLNEARKTGLAGDLATALDLLAKAEEELRHPRKWLGNAGVPRIAALPLDEAVQPEELSFAAAESLRMGFDGGGRLVTVELAGREEHRGALGGFYALDAKTGKSSSFRGRISGTRNNLDLSGGFEGLEARLEAGITDHGTHLDVQGTLQDTAGRDRAIVLCFKIPCRAMTWWDDADLAMSIPPGGGILQNSAPLSSASQATRLASIYPLGCITAGDKGLAIGTAIDHPAVFRINYDSLDKSLNLYYDFGLTDRASRFPGQARFHFVIYALDEPQWGFRSALDRYYRIFPRAFTGRIAQAGLWGTVEAAEKLGEPYKKMGFSFLQGENGNPTWGKRLGLWSLRYCRPWNFFVPGPTAAAPGGLAGLAATPGTLAVQPSHRLIFGPATEAQLVRGAELSVIHDAAGQPVTGADRVRGGVNYVLNPDPEIAGKAAECNAAQLTIEEAIIPAARNYRNRGQERWGLFFDVAGSLLRYENFRSTHMATADFPLTFDETGKRPVILNISSACEYLAHVRELAAAEGGMVAVNTSPHPYNMVFLSPFCDMAGTEHLPGRREMNNRLALARHRPIGFRTAESWEELLKHGLFYGAFPSRVPPGKVRTRLEHLEQASPLLTRVVPLIRAVSGAGWEPLTRARITGTGGPQLQVERFGSPDRGPVYFTVWNRSTGPQTVTLELDAAARGWFGGNPRAVELAGHRKVTAGEGRISLLLEGDGVALVRLDEAKSPPGS